MPPRSQRRGVEDTGCWDEFLVDTVDGKVANSNRMEHGSEWIFQLYWIFDDIFSPKPVGGFFTAVDDPAIKNSGRGCR